jgi:hypothetical protein
MAENRIKGNWMNLAEWIKRLTANAKVATVLGSISASSDTVDSAGAADVAVLKKVHNKLGQDGCKK